MQESTKYLLVGGGVASVAAAQAIRERDKEGRLMMVCAEEHMPYDRPPLSKGFLTNKDMTPDDVSSKFDNFYPDNNVELLLGVAATAIDTQKRTVKLSDGRSVQYEKMLLATGATPKTPPIKGQHKEGLYLLRTVDDSLAIRNAMDSAEDLLIIGTGFIGMEVAAQAVSRGLTVTVVCRDDLPWGAFASDRLGSFLRHYYESRGVKFFCGDEVTAMEPGPRVITAKNSQFEPDMVVAGVGVTLNTKIAEQAWIDTDPVEGVKVNEFLQSSDPNVFAAGDIAFFQDRVLGKRWHAEHFLNARWQGKRAGANMAGDMQPYDEVPYFFSDMLDLHMILRGDPTSGKDTKVLGVMDDAEFVELYPREDGKLGMGIAFSRDEKKLDPISDKLEELIRRGATVAELQASDFGY